MHYTYLITGTAITSVKLNAAPLTTSPGITGIISRGFPLGFRETKIKHVKYCCAWPVWLRDLIYEPGSHGSIHPSRVGLAGGS